MVTDGVGVGVGVLVGSWVGDQVFLGVRVLVAELVPVAEGVQVLDAIGWDVRVGSWVMVAGCVGGSEELPRFDLHAAVRPSTTTVAITAATVLNAAMLTATPVSSH